MTETPETVSQTPRHVLRVERYPGLPARMWIDDKEVRVVRVRWTADVSEVLYEQD